MRPSSLRRLRSASPTADHSTSPTKHKTDDCTPLQSSASLISSVPPRHQTCRAESSKAAHFPDKSALSAAYRRHLRNIIQPLLCDCPSGLPPGRGSAHTAHNPDYVKYLPPPPSRKWTRTEPLYLRTRVSTFSKERAECRPRHPPIWLSAITRCVSGQHLRPLPTTGAHRLRLLPLQTPRISRIPSETACPPASRFGAAPTQGQYIRSPPRTGTSPSRRGERYHHTHSRLHPASRAQTLIRPSGVMRVSSSAPQPAAAPLHPPHPSPSTQPPSSDSRASLFVFRDPVLTHLRHSTLPGSPAATVSGRGRCALPSASSPLPSSPQAACTAAPRASGQCPAPPSTDPPPKAEDRRRSLSKVHGLSREPLTPPLLRTGQFAPLTRRPFR